MTAGIWTLIEQYLDRSVDTDPRDVARSISKVLSESHKARYFDELLPSACVNHNSRIRRNPPRPATFPVPPREQPASSKVAAIRAHDWGHELRQRYKVGHEWVRLGEMTHDHLTAIARSRRRVGDVHHAIAVQFDRLDQMLRTSHARTVADLPEHAALAAWKGVAE